MSPLAVKLIKTFEGFSPVVYNCGGGYSTIGYGHRLWKQEDGVGPLKEDVATSLLLKDLTLVERYLEQLVRIPLKETQEAALLSFMFNVGPAAFERSTLRIKVNREEHHDIPFELMRWVFAGGRRSRGLERRRFVEGKLYETGRWVMPT